MNSSSHPHERFRKIVLGCLGVGLGAALFYLALRGVDAGEVKRIFRALQPGFIAAAWLSYVASIAVRAIRWRLLLSSIVSACGLSAVTETLVAGYAVNNLLPARLGELFRADYAKRRLQISRASALGSIVVERLLDGVVVAALLWFGLALQGLVRSHSSANALWSIAVTASVLLGVVLVVILLLVRVHSWHRRLPAKLAVRIEQMIDGLASLQRGPTATIGGATCVVWALESLALWLMFRAIGQTLSPGEVCMLMGAATLSTLVPTAPAYLGSYQFVFVTAMRVFGRPESAGIVAATSIQIVFYGTVTVTGLVIMIVRASSSLRKRS